MTIPPRDGSPLVADPQDPALMTCSCHADDLGPVAGRSLGRRHVLAGGLAAGLLPLLPRFAGAAGAQDADGPATRDFSFLPPRPAAERHVRPIMFPVLPDATLGRATWTDTYLAPRGGGRRHEGQDLMGRKMLKLLAVTNGTIVELRHQAGGNSLYLRGDDGYYYCYLHINNDRPGTDDGYNSFGQAFAPGMAIGRRVAKGELLAYLGDSGNAEGSGSHLHFEIRLPNARWYNAAACNARYALEAAEPARLRAKVPNSTFAPLPNATEFATRVANDFLGKVPSAAWLTSAVGSLEWGSISPDAFIEARLADNQFQREVNPTIRLYQAYFGGIPTFAGVDFWVKRLRAGQSLDSASNEMAGSSRFRSTYNVTSDRDFVRTFFRNLYGREPSEASIELRLKQLRSGMTRGAVVRYDCESAGYRSPTANRTRVISVYHAMVKEAPTPYYLDHWVAIDKASAGGMRELIRAHRTGAKYAARR